MFKTLIANADNVTTGYAGLRFDKPLGLQTFQLGFTQRTTKYERFSYQDFDGQDYGAKWLWFLGPRVNGILSYDHVESQTPFQDTSFNRLRNLRTTENYEFTLDGWMTGNWHLMLGASQNDQKSEQSAAVVTTPDFQARNADVGIKYITPAGNSAALVRRSTRGENQNIFVSPSNPSSNNYTETLTDLKTNWRITSNSSLNGYAGWRERRTETIFNSDFSGPALALTYAWVPTTTLNFTFLVGMDRFPVQDPSFSYAEQNRLSFTSDWRFSAITSARLTLSRLDYHYRGTGPVIAAGPARSDTSDNAEIGLYWQPLRRVTLDASVRREQRSSNTVLNNYNATIGQVGASLSF